MTIPFLQENVIEGVFTVGETLEFKEIFLDAGAHDVISLLENVLADHSEVFAFFLRAHHSWQLLFKFSEGVLEAFVADAFLVENEKTEFKRARQTLVLVEFRWIWNRFGHASEFLIEISELLAL